MKSNITPTTTGGNAGCAHHELRTLLQTLASKVARKIEENHFTKRGTICDESTGESRDTFPENFREALRGDAFSAAAIAFFGMPEKRQRALFRRLSKGGKSKALLKLYRPAFREAQGEFRKLNHDRKLELTSYHEDLAFVDAPEKSPLDAAWDAASLRARTALKLKLLREYIQGVRAYHAAHPSRQAISALRADVARIARCAQYYFRGVMAGAGFDFAEVLRPGGNGGWRLNDTYARTFARARAGMSLRPVSA